MPYICMRRSDIPNGVLQVLDLWPNSSNRNVAYDPAGQSKYLRGVENDTVVLISNATHAEYTGLTAYLLDVIANGTSGNALTVAEAAEMATAIIERVRAGSAVTASDVNTILDDVVTDTSIDADGSIGSLAEILEILAGGHYVLSAGTAADSSDTFKGTQAGSFASGTYRATYDGAPLRSSLATGTLSHLADSMFSYAETEGAAVVVYDDDGSVLS